MPRKSKKRVTLQDIAEVLNLSRGTVDRAVHNRGRINEATRKRILDKASEMGYIDEKINRFSTLKKKDRIIALMPETPAFFYAQIREGMRHAFAELKEGSLELEVLEYSTEDHEGWRKLLVSCRKDEDVKGILLVPSGRFDPSRSFPGGKKLPCITVNTDLPESTRLCFVGQDLYQSGRIGGEMITKISSESTILIISGFKDLWAHEERVRGALDYLSREAPECRVEIRYCSDDPATAAESVKTFQSESGIKSILAVTGAATVGAVRGIRELKMKSHIPLVGFDYSGELSEALDDGICDALIGQNPEEQGALAFKLMYQIIASGYTPAREHFITSTELFLRELKPFLNPLTDFLN